jgi:DNA-binding response OmpR family regulator
VIGRSTGLHRAGRHAARDRRPRGRPAVRAHSDAYVVMLTARDRGDRQGSSGCRVGADDYVVKPFSPRELVARVQAMLRRPRAGAGDAPRQASVLTVADLVVDPESRQVTVAGREVELTRTEFDLLATMAARPRTAFSREQLVEAVWGPGWFGDAHVVDVHVGHLRRKLGDTSDEPRFIRTVRGVGYRMVDA